MLEWWKPIAIILMLPAALLVVIGLTTPNPTSIAQEGRVGQPPQGIVRITRHPFLTGVGLWALVHLIGNGDVASLVFFATWAIVALAGTVSIDRKRQRLLGAAWEPFAAQTSIVPFAAIAAGRNWPLALGCRPGCLRTDAGRTRADHRRLTISRVTLDRAPPEQFARYSNKAPEMHEDIPGHPRPDIYTKRRWRPRSVTEPAMIMKCS